jgi:hypothetical protein
MKTQGSMFPEHVPDQHFDYDGEFKSDDYETPSNAAQKIASLVLPSDLNVLEPAAGTGQIAKLLPTSTVAVEIQKSRYQLGRSKAPLSYWYCADFLSPDSNYFLSRGFTQRDGFDLIVTNPPFSLGMEFIVRSLSLLNLEYEHARLLFLLPTDYFQAQGVNQVFTQLDCYIHRAYQFAGRVAYLKSGVAESGRMRNDCVFDIRPGKHQGGVVFL